MILSEACGIDWKKKSTGQPKIDGMSLWPSLNGKGEHPRNELLLWHGMEAEPQSIRVGNWKLFFDRRHALEGSGSKRKTEEQAEKIAGYIKELKQDQVNPPILFNVSKDPGETEDLSGTFPSKAKSMQERADQLMKQMKQEGILQLSVPK